MKYAVPPEVMPTVEVAGSDERYPVHRIYCVGRNYAAHAREMGKDPEKEPPFFFMKPADAVLPVPFGSTGEMPYPGETNNLHHEIGPCLCQRGRGLPEQGMASIEATELELAAHYARIGKQQAAQGALAQGAKTQIEGMPGAPGHDRVGEDDGDAVAAEQHLPHPDPGAGPQAEKGAFIPPHRLQALAQAAHGKLPAGSLQAGRQGALLAQPGKIGGAGGEAGQIVPPAAPGIPPGHFWGGGSRSTPPMLAPALMPLAANQPWFISRAKRASLSAQWLFSVWGCMSRMLMMWPLSSRKATERGMRVFFIHMQCRAAWGKMKSMPWLGAIWVRCIRPCMRSA